MREPGWGEGHPSEATLRDFADGKLARREEAAVEGHLVFECPGGRCHRVLHRHPNAIDALLRAAARGRRAAERRAPCTG